MPLHTLRADIDYGLYEARTTFGQIGVKVWIYKVEARAGRANQAAEKIAAEAAMAAGETVSRRPVGTGAASTGAALDSESDARNLRPGAHVQIDEAGMATSEEVLDAAPTPKTRAVPMLEDAPEVKAAAAAEVQDGVANAEGETPASEAEEAAEAIDADEAREASGEEPAAESEGGDA